MSVFQENIYFFRGKYPEVFDAVNKFNEVVNRVDQRQYISCLTKNDEPNLEIQVEGKSLFLHSKYNAKAEAEKWGQSICNKIIGVKHLFIFGIGLGYFLEEILLRTDAQDIFIYEPDMNIFNEYINKKLVSSTLLDKRIKLLAIGDDGLTQYHIANIIAGYISDAFVTVSAPIYERLYPEVVRSFESITREMILNQIATFQTLRTYQNEWLRNILHNIPQILMSTSLIKLKEAWKGQDVTAIIVGSGPSLKEDIHHLRELRNKCLIIAAGSSIQAMNHYEISPHFVVSLEGSENYNRVFQDVNVSSVPLMFCTQTNCCRLLSNG